MFCSAGWPWATTLPLSPTPLSHLYKGKWFAFNKCCKTRRYSLTLEAMYLLNWPLSPKANILLPLRETIRWRRHQQRVFINMELILPLCSSKIVGSSTLPARAHKLYSNKILTVLTEKLKHFVLADYTLSMEKRVRDNYCLPSKSPLPWKGKRCIAEPY